MQKRYRATLLAACLMSASVWSHALEIPKEATLNKVVVRKHDTLWAIAGTHLRDPQKWPKIWKLNQNSINNPNLIYPDQIIFLPQSVAAPAQASAKPLSVIHAHVVSVLDGTSTSGPQTILVIDKGTQDGVKTGLVMTLYRKGNAAAIDGNAETSRSSYGRLVVFRTEAKQSYASTLPANLAVGLMDGARISVGQRPVPGVAKVATSQASPSVMAPHQLARHHFERRGSDARACLRLKSDRNIAACAEKYR